MVDESWENPERYTLINALSKIHILECIKNEKFLEKYIYISTPEILALKHSIDELNKDYNPSTPYALTKLSCELYLKNLHQNYNFKSIITRFSNFYGPGQTYYRLIPKLILSIYKNKKFPLQGNGKSKRNFIFTDDFCDGIYKVLKKGGRKNISFLWE